MDECPSLHGHALVCVYVPVRLRVCVCVSCEFQTVWATLFLHIRAPPSSCASWTLSERDQARDASSALLDEATDRVCLDHVEIHLMPKEITNVVDLVENHSGPFQRQAPGNAAHVFGEAHWPEHLRAEHARVADFHVFVEPFVPVEDLHRGLRVRVVGRLKADVSQPQLQEKRLDHAHQIPQIQVAVHDQPFDLMELRQVSGVERLVAEYAVDREELLRLKRLHLRQLVQHLR